MMTTEDYIVAKDLVKVYKLGKVEVQALRGLSIQVREGEFVTVMGASGSGKTTLLNILGGLTRATAGTAHVAGLAITNLSLEERTEIRQKTVGHIFQTLNLIPALTAAENVELPMLTSNTSTSKRRERVQELLDIVGLTPRASHKPGELSGGEQQRVAIAAALANDPPVILADEPIGELDTVTSQQIVDFLLKINRELGKTILMVTHDPRVARQTDRIFRIEDGRIKAAYVPTTAPPKNVQANIDFLKHRVDETLDEMKNLDQQLTFCS